jgi:hypothetical protein
VVGGYLLFRLLRLVDAFLSQIRFARHCHQRGPVVAPLPPPPRWKRLLPPCPKGSKKKGTTASVVASADSGESAGTVEMVLGPQTAFRLTAWVEARRVMSRS